MWGILILSLPFASISNTEFSYTHYRYQSRIILFLTWSQHTLSPSAYIYHIESGSTDLDLDLESLARDISDLQYLLAQDSSRDDDEDLDLESRFPTVTQIEVEAIVVDLPPEQVRTVVDLTDYGPGAEIDIENPDDLQQVLIR